MIKTRKAQELDIVELTEDLPQYGVKKGEQAVVITAFEEPDEAYDLEFVDESGTSSRFAYSIKPEQITNVYACAEERLQQGIALLQAGLTLKGRQKLRQAVKLNPQLIGVLLNSILESFSNSEAWDQLIPALRLLIQLDPSYELARNNLVIAMLNYGVQQAIKGDIGGALQIFYSAIGIESSAEITSWVKHNLAVASTSLGIQAYQEGNYQLALNQMARACGFETNAQTRHNLALANALLGQLILKEGNFLGAIDLFEVAEDAGLAFPKLYNNHAVALAAIGQMDGAIELLERTLEIDPDYRIAEMNLMEIEQARIGGVSEFEGYREELDLAFDQLLALQQYEYQLAA